MKNYSNIACRVVDELKFMTPKKYRLFSGKGCLRKLNFIPSVIMARVTNSVSTQPFHTIANMNLPHTTSIECPSPDRSLQ